MNQKMNEFRTDLAKRFIEVLEMEPLKWSKNWIDTNRYRAFNAKTQKSYHGINSFLLSIVSMQRGYTDPRFATFAQIKDMGLRLENAKGMGIKIEYWMPKNIKTNKIIAWTDYNALSKEEKQEYTLLPKYSVVFNAEHIKGLSPLPPMNEKYIIGEFQLSKCFENLIKNMNIEVIEFGNEAFYNTIADYIQIPKRTHFNTEYDFYSTLAHELAHATMHPLRLNRSNDNYSLEELRAEISSCIFCSDTGLKLTEEHLKEHQAYVQSWIKNIKDKPSALVESIKNAEKIANYLEYQAELINEKEFELLNNNSLVVVSKDDKIVPLEINETIQYEKNIF